MGITFKLDALASVENTSGNIMCQVHICLRISKDQIGLPVEFLAIEALWSAKVVSGNVLIVLTNIFQGYSVQEAGFRDELGVVDGVAVEVWVKGEDALSQSINGNTRMSNSFEIGLGRSTSAKASIFLPVIVVGLNDVPFSILSVEFVFMNSTESGSADDDTFVVFGASDGEVAKRVDLFVLEVLVGAIVVFTGFESVSDHP